MCVLCGDNVYACFNMKSKKRNLDFLLIVARFGTFGSSVKCARFETFGSREKYARFETSELPITSVWENNNVAHGDPAREECLVYVMRVPPACDLQCIIRKMDVGISWNKLCFFVYVSKSGQHAILRFILLVRFVLPSVHDVSARNSA